MSAGMRCPAGQSARQQDEALIMRIVSQWPLSAKSWAVFAHVTSSSPSRWAAGPSTDVEDNEPIATFSKVLSSFSFQALP